MLDFEPNNTVGLAKLLTPGTYDIGGTGSDWYRIDANPGLLRVEMTEAAGFQMNMILYNSQMQVVAGNFQPNKETLSLNVSAKDAYFVEIYPVGSNQTRYSLFVDYPATSWSKTLNFGPIRDVSTSLFDIDNDDKDEIFIGTSKALDANFNEVRPAGFIVLEDDGTIKWTVSFPAMATPDPTTGKTYKTTSVTTAPAFADIDGDGKMEIFVGTGGDSIGEAGAVGQPGDRGGLYALDAQGQVLWFHQSLDVIGGASGTGEGRPDGVYGSPVVFDIDGDGKREVIYNSWDQRMWILDARTGAVELELPLLDTIWSTPKIADLTGDGTYEILVTADITANADARTQTGGLFHVIAADGTQNTPGFNQFIGNPNYTTLKGKFEEQVLWSSPVTADLDRDGRLEIIYGTGNFFNDSRGSFIRVWDADGNAKLLLPTFGRTMATPLAADIDGDGDIEIVAATLEGYVYGWDHTGKQLFATKTISFPNQTGGPIFSAPIAVDMDGDRKLEILVTQGTQVIVLNSQGQQLSNPNIRQNIFEFYKGSPAVKDIDNDGKLDIIYGGNTVSKDQAVVFRADNIFNANLTEFIDGRYQFHQATNNIDKFIERFYLTTLSRSSEPAGSNYWIETLNTGILAGADVAYSFINSQEFVGRNLSDNQYIDVLYRVFFGREPDAAGVSYWQGLLNAGKSRADVLNGFIYSQEFKNICASFGIKPWR